MDSPDISLALNRQEIVKRHLEVAAVIQDIQQCTGPLELLNELNAEGRGKIAKLRSSIECLSNLAETESNLKRRSELLLEIEDRKNQLTMLMAMFKKANIVAACVIDKMSKEELLSMSEQQQNLLRKRRDRQNFADTVNKATDRLMSISRTLAETTQRSANTLDTLLTSSDKVIGTKEELENQQQVIVQSGKLLGKYGRREITDKVLLTLAFLFFLTVVFYIIQKRMW